MKKASLLIIENNARKTLVMPLTQQRYQIGRSGYVQGESTIALDSDIVSREHGEIRFQAGHWVYCDLNSSNGTFVDGHHLYGDSAEIALSDGSFIRIDGDRDFTKCFSEKGVLMVFCEGDYKNQKWLNYPLDAKLTDYVRVGRDASSDIVLNEPSVSGNHGVFFKKGDRLFYRDVHRSFDTTINGEILSGESEIIDKDVLMISTVKMIYTNGMLFYTDKVSGTHLSVRHLTKTVKDSENKLRKKTILNDVSVDIASSELVAILGTSGAGKSTFVNAVIGYEKATSGEVLIGGVNLYNNKKSVRKQIGYVPQFDLLRGNLSVESTLRYVAKLRLPKDTSKAEREKRIDDCLAMLDIDASLKKNRIRTLSGGQRKRVSIAAELIPGPPLVFLDEPTSGLDPETEMHFVKMLSSLSHRQGKTLIVITHTLKNINYFDQIMFLGPGGKLCYYGPPRDVLDIFGVEDIIDIYEPIREHVDYYADKYKKQMENDG